MTRYDNSRLYAYLKQQKAAHTERFTSYDDFRRYYKSIFTSITSDFLTCTFTRDEAAEVISNTTTWLQSLAPVKEWDKKTGEPTSYYSVFTECFDDAINDWYKLCEGNKTIVDALNSLNLPDDPSLTADKVKPLLWNFLYSANHTDLNTSIKSLCEWLLQCKGNLRGDNHHHHPLLYISRDREDGSARGGNGKSYICETLVDGLSKRGLPATVATGSCALPAARSEFTSDAFSKNLLIAINELPSIHHINEPVVRTIFEDKYYSVRKMRTDPYSVEVSSMFIGSTNYQDWFSTDSAFARRLHLVNINADLQLADRRVCKEVNDHHVLPTEDEIVEAFTKLLQVPDEVYYNLIDECGDGDSDTATDLDEYIFAKLLRHLQNDKAIDLKCVKMIAVREELKAFEGNHRKWGSLNQKAVNEILNKHFGHKGVQYFHGDHLHTDHDLSVLANYKAPNYAARLNPIEAYDKVYDALHPSKYPPATDPDDFDAHEEDEAELATEDSSSLPSIPQSNTSFDNQRAKPVWDSTDGDYQFESLNPIDPVKAQESISSGDSKTGCKDSTVASMRNFVFECDGVSLDVQKQRALTFGCNGIANRAVYSGGKSIHTRITIDFEPRSLDEYKLIWKVLNDRLFKGTADPACANPSRKTRRPNGFRYDKDVTQDLLFENDNVFRLSTHRDIMEDIRGYEEAEAFKVEFNKRDYEVKESDRSNSEAVRHFLDTPFQKGVKHGGDAHSSFYKAVLSCIGGLDEDTLGQVIVKAKSEGWKDSEIRSTERDARKYLAKKG